MYGSPQKIQEVISNQDLNKRWAFMKRHLDGIGTEALVHYEAA
jgi:hypothetical protein